MSKTQRLNAEIKGLITSAGDLVKPPGATDVVDNFDLSTPGFLVQRRGIKRYDPITGGNLQSYTLGGGGISNIPMRLFSTIFWANNASSPGSWMVGHFTDGTGAPGLLNLIRDGSSGSPVVPLPTPDSTAFTFPEQTLGGLYLHPSRLMTYNKNSFFVGGPTTVRLEQKNDVQGPAGDGVLSYAGMPRPPGIAWEQQTQPELSPDGSGGVDPTFWLALDHAVGYRCTFVATDKDGVERESAPSAKYIIVNSSDYQGFSAGKTAAPITAWQIPYMTNTASTKWNTQFGAFGPLKIKIYRTISVDIATAVPGEDYYLCYEGTLSSSELAAGYTTVIDYTPEVGLTDTAYFNSTIGGDISTGLVMPNQTALGLAASNDRPPFALDGAVFQNCAFYGNVKPPTSLTISIIAVGTSGNVLKAGDSIITVSSFGTITLGAVAAVPGANQFRIHNTNVPSAAWSLRRTCENLCAAINKYNTSITAVYIGDPSNPESAGKIYIECNLMQDTTLQFYTSLITSPPWIQPTVQPTAGVYKWFGTQVSKSNALAVSKPNILDAVPPVNYQLIGGNQQSILRVIATSDALFIFLTQGVWTCRGTGPSNFVFQEFDPTFKLLHPESVTVLNDRIYAWGQQGIYRFSVSGGAEILDGGIKNYTNAILQYNRPSISVQFFGWAFAQPNNNQVQFWYSDGADEAHPPTGNASVGYQTRALVYHENTNAWTTYSGGISTIPDANHRYRIPYINAVYRQWDQMSFYLSYNISGVTFNTAYLLGMDPTATTGPVSQQDQLPFDTNLLPVTSSVQWQVTIPNPNGICHWSDFEYYTQPYLFGPDGSLANNSLSPVNVYITSDMSKSTNINVTQLTADKGRIILSSENGYATRQTVKLTVSGAFFAFNGFSFLVRQLGGNNTR